MRTSQLWKYFSIWGVLLCHTCSLPTESSYSPTLPGQATQEETSFILLKSKICKEETSSIFYMKALFNPVMCREETASGTYETLQSRYSNVREAQDLVHQTSTTSSAYLAHQPNNTGSAYPPSQDLDPQVTNSSYAPSQDLTHQSNNTSSAYLPSQDLQHKLSYASHAYKPIQNTIKRTFGNFSFGIGFSKNSSRMSRAEVLKSVDTQLSEQLFLNVMVEGSPGDTELIVHSCQLMDRRNTSIGAYIIQEGCLSDKTAEEVVLGNSKEKIYSLRLSSLPTASEVFVMCEVQLCKNLRRSQHCLLGCGSKFRISRSQNAVLETSIYRIRAGPIRITKETSSTASNYTASVIGVVLGSTVVAVVVLLVKKSFVGVRYQQRFL